jgi:hypothetical protein
VWGLLASRITRKLESYMNIWALCMRAGRESHFGMMANGMIKSSSACSRVSGKLGMSKRRLGVGAP